jgi:hypothetical protein
VVSAPPVRLGPDRTKALVAAIARPPARPALRVRHAPPASFRRGQPVAVELAVAEPVTSVTLRYRAVDQSRAWSETAMARSGTGYAATIADTDTPFPLQYYFELVAGSPAAAVIHPGHDLRHQSRQRKGRVLVCRVEPDDIVEAFLQLVQLIRRQAPVLGFACAPQLGMAHLVQGHDLSETRTAFARAPPGPQDRRQQGAQSVATDHATSLSPTPT